MSLKANPNIKSNSNLKGTKAPIVIGLTGGIGSGKTAASDMFAEFGITVVDADVVAREVVEPGSPVLAQIEKTFGKEVLLEDGRLNRAKLRDRIFTNEKDKVALNNIMQPAIRHALLKQLSEATSAYVILSAPLLLENGLEQVCHRVLVVDVPHKTQVTRASSRDRVSAEQITAIIASQIDRDSRLAKADDVIDNNQDLVFLKEQVVKLHNKYLTLGVG